VCGDKQRVDFTTVLLGSKYILSFFPSVCRLISYIIGAWDVRESWWRLPWGFAFKRWTWQLQVEFVMAAIFLGFLGEDQV
jgi:hypothetical protein